jgi:arylsulfatase A-like enzyme/phage tail protein X
LFGLRPTGQVEQESNLAKKVWRKSSWRIIGVASCILLSLLARTSFAEPTSGSRDGAHGELRGVLLLVIDTLRADHLGAYGSTLGLTPNLDGLAEQGLLFERATAASSWTRASMATIHLGVAPSVHGVVDREHSLPPGLPTLAESLSSTGVETAGLHGNVNLDASFGFGRGFDRYGRATRTEKYPADERRQLSAATLTREVLAEIDEHKLGQERPFFFWAHYIDPHDPYFDHPELGRGTQPAGRFDGSRKALAKLDALPAQRRTQADEDRIRFLYEGEVAWVDRQVGALIDGLRSRELLDDLLIVITSDHGEGLWQHGERAHGRDLYEEQIHVPMILVVPKSWEHAPSRVAARVAHEDIPSTILKALGVPMPVDWTGKDLVAIAADPSLGRSQVRSSLSLDWRNLGTLLEGNRKAIRNRSFDPQNLSRVHVTRKGDTWIGLSWKYFGTGRAMVRLKAANPELVASGALSEGARVRIPDPENPPAQLLEVYDLATDPRESRNVVGLDTDFDTRASQSLAASAEPSAAPETPLSEMDSEVLENLRGLGYLD